MPSQTAIHEHDAGTAKQVRVLQRLLVIQDGASLSITSTTLAGILQPFSLHYRIVECRRDPHRKQRQDGTEVGPLENVNAYRVHAQYEPHARPFWRDPAPPWAFRT